MKILFALAACAACIVSASKTNNYQYSPVTRLLQIPSENQAPNRAPVPTSTGTSSQYRQQDVYGNYNFGYEESHSSGGSSRHEERSNGVVRGSYSLNDLDGRRRVVYYVADADGFRVSIETNEPGVEPKDSADVLINRAAPVALYPFQGQVIEQEQIQEARQQSQIKGYAQQLVEQSQSNSDDDFDIERTK